MRNPFAFYVVVSLVLFLSSCKKEVVDPVDSAKMVLAEALDSLYAHNYGKYLSLMDLGEEMNDEQLKVMFDVLCQHQERQEVLKGTVSSCRIVDAKLEADSVAIVYYEITFSDGTSEGNTQKMICVDDKWKIRVRN